MQHLYKSKWQELVTKFGYITRENKTKVIHFKTSNATTYIAYFVSTRIAKDIYIRKTQNLYAIDDTKSYKEYYILNEFKNNNPLKEDE